MKKKIIYLWLFHDIDLKLCYKGREPEDGNFGVNDNNGYVDDKNGYVHDKKEYVDNKNGYVDNKNGYVDNKKKIKPLLLLIQVLFFILRFYHLIKILIKMILASFDQTTVLMQMNVSILFVVLLNSR